MGIREEWKKRVLLFDGGMGSLLQEKGLAPGELPETWNLRHPDILVEIHKSYLDAGADIILANTFGANALKYNEKTDYSLSEILCAGIENAKEAVRQAGHGYVALDIGPTGKLLKPMGELDFEQAVELYAKIVKIGTACGVDLIVIETMSDTYELKAAVLAAKEYSDLPVFATTIFDSRGKLLTGGTPKSVVALLEGLGADALGINCGLGPVQMKPFAEELLQYASVPVIVNPNAGLPRSEKGKTVYDIKPEEFAAAMEELLELGVSMIGGCCGTTPEHIRLLKKICGDRKAPVITQKDASVITSYAAAVEFGREPVIIGERINPTGKSKLKQALREHNLEYILREAVTQQENGAAVLDVNVGLPEIDEPAMMRETVQQLQAVTELPLQIDTSNVEAMERALRIYNGKALINSVNGKKEVMDAVFPLVKKYGGMVVALTLDETGIPESADGRIAIARRIYQEAEAYGIAKKDILIDALCMTISSDPNSALVTLQTVKRVKEELGGKTILGVSNISFGLPQREIVNAAFFTLALQNGLDAAIINPNAEAMMRSYYSYRALAALDEHCSDYIRMYGQKAAKQAGEKNGVLTAGAGENAKQEPEEQLFQSVLKGLKEQAAKSAAELLKARDPLSLIHSVMIPALDQVGKGFEAGNVFLPQLLMSAEAAKSAFEVIRDRMEQSGQAGQKKGCIVLATVKGDIHDIGKNIVKVLLENYSYEVIDLGRDVSPEKITTEAVRLNVPLVGLSALMTTTVPAMEETIRQLRKEAPWVKVMVGGAVLTESYAASIGADAYCKDAMASVHFAQQVISP